MSTQIIISKKGSGHNLLVSVSNPGSLTEQRVLQDGQFAEVLIHGEGTVTLAELPKTPVEAEQLPG